MFVCFGFFLENFKTTSYRIGIVDKNYLDFFFVWMRYKPLIKYSIKLCVIILENDVIPVTPRMTMKSYSLRIDNASSRGKVNGVREFIPYIIYRKRQNSFLK